MMMPPLPLDDLNDEEKLDAWKEINIQTGEAACGKAREVQMGKLLKGNWRSEEKIVIIDAGGENETRVRFEDLPVQLVIRIKGETEYRFYILGMDDDGKLHMIRDRDGGSLDWKSRVPPFAG